jgi:hypothetical protein
MKKLFLIILIIGFAQAFPQTKKIKDAPVKEGIVTDIIDREEHDVPNIQIVNGRKVIDFLKPTKTIPEHIVVFFKKDSAYISLDDWINLNIGDHILIKNHRVYHILDKHNDLLNSSGFGFKSGGYF